MRGFANLAARVRRLESRRRAVRVKAPIVFTLHSDIAGEIVALATIGGQIVGRELQEPLADLTARAAALTGRRVLMAVFAPTAAPPSH